ncbi:MAG: hypothetical protein KBF76_08235 [Verrucomicrobiales bacterium]|nr:hypothetical protein [Verrucomicrobiales bacterium]
MTTWGYLILIAALTFLAAIMLYARFANRSREKSLHHPPVDLMFPYETISVAPPAETDTAAVFLAGVDLAASEGINDVTMDRLEPPFDRTAIPNKRAEQENRYFDELQEAAAGLAMLMRSSPVGRTEPVIFAPESDESDFSELESLAAEIVKEVVASADLVEEPIAREEFALIDESLVVPESAFEENEIPGSEIVIENEDVLAQDEVVLTQDEVVLTQDEVVLAQDEVALAQDDLVLALGEVVLALENEAIAVENEMLAHEEIALAHEEVVILSRAELLGDQVCEKLDLLDENLDALEALIFNIESSLRALDGVSTGEAYPERHQEGVSVAA